MIRSILLLAATWLSMTLLGMLVLAKTPGGVRDRMLPAAPLVGIALVIAVLHWTTLVVPVPAGLVVLGVVVAGLLVLVHRGPGLRALWPSRSALVALFAAAFLGLLPAAFVLAPSLANGGVLVLPTPNHDAFYYVSTVEWLGQHPGIEPPLISRQPVEGDAPLGFAPAEAIISSHLRIGESLAQAGIVSASGQSAAAVFFPALALWTLTLVGSVTAAFRLLGLPTVAGLVGGSAAAAYPLVLYQAYNQNAASLLGIAFAPIAIVAVAIALDRAPGVPRWLAALLLVGWLGSYTEYAAIGGPAVLVVLLLRRPRELRAAVRAGAVVGALALVMAPLLWANAVRSLLFLGSLVETPRSTPITGVSVATVLNRLTGASTYMTGLKPDGAAPLLAGVLALGLLLAVVYSRRRALWLGVVLALVLTIGRLAGAERPYTLMRLLEIGLPLVVVVASVGWTCAVVAARGRPVPARAPVIGLALVVAVGWTAVEGRTSWRFVQESLVTPRPVDGDYAEASTWVGELGGEQGALVTVLTGDFFQQLWIASALTRYEDTAYPALAGDYLGLTSYWGGESDPFLLVDNEVFVAVDPSMVVRSNDRFRLIDLRRGRGVVLTSTPAAGLPWLGERPQTWTSQDAEMFMVCATAGECAADVEVSALQTTSPVDFTVLQEGEVVGRGRALFDRPTQVRITLTGGRRASRLVLDLADSPGDPTVGPAPVAAGPGAATPPAVRLLEVRPTGR